MSLSNTYTSACYKISSNKLQISSFQLSTAYLSLLNDKVFMSTVELLSDYYVLSICLVPFVEEPKLILEV